MARICVALFFLSTLLCAATERQSGRPHGDQDVKAGGENICDTKLVFEALKLPSELFVVHDDAALWQRNIGNMALG